MILYTLIRIGNRYFSIEWSSIEGQERMALGPLSVLFILDFHQIDALYWWCIAMETHCPSYTLKLKRDHNVTFQFILTELFNGERETSCVVLFMK